MDRLNKIDFNEVLRNTDATTNFDTWFYDAGLE